jgi:hypothetical protein
MIVRVRRCTGEREVFWCMLGEVVQRASHLKEKLVGHFAGEAVADKDALDDQIFAVGRHRGIGSPVCMHFEVYLLGVGYEKKRWSSAGGATVTPAPRVSS